MQNVCAKNPKPVWWPLKEWSFKSIDRSKPSTILVLDAMRKHYGITTR